MPLYRDDAVVLRAQKLGEADRIITLLTREHGKVRAVGKGVRRTGSRFGARLEPFMHIDVQLNEGRTFDVVTQVDTIGAYARDICIDYGRYTVAGALVETADRLIVAEREPSVQQFWLLAGALRTLASQQVPADLILDSYLLRAFAVAGYAPSFDVCAQCGVPGPHTAFSVAAGGAVCARCRPPGSASPAPGTFTHMAALLAGEWGVVLSSSDRHVREARGLIAAFTQYHLERTIRSLRFVERSSRDSSSPS